MEKAAQTRLNFALSSDFKPTKSVDPVHCHSSLRDLCFTPADITHGRFRNACPEFPQGHGL